MKNIVDFTSKIKEKFTMRKDIAPVEESSTASRAYSAGDKFYYGNLLQKAITDIAQGAALVGGTNFENADPVTTTIQNLSTVISKNGAHNLVNLKDTSPVSSGTTISNITDNGFTVANTTDSKYPSSKTPLSLVVGREYIVDFDVTAKQSALSRLAIRSVNDTIKYSQRIETTGHYSLRFTYDDGYYLSVFPYYSDTTAGQGSITIGNLILKDAEDESNVITPYAMTNRQLTTDKVGMDLLSEVGAVNYLKNNASSQIEENVTYQVNDDKSITVSANGTSNTNNSNLVLSNHGFYLKAGTYKLSCKGLPANKGYLRLSDPFTEGSFPTVTSEDNDIVFTVSSAQESTAVYIFLRIAANKAISATLYPMIVPVEYNGSYVPHAKTNRELTEDVASINSYIDNFSVGKETIIRMTNESGTWGYFGKNRFTASTTIQDIITYLKNNSIKADRVVIYSNAQSTTGWGASLPDRNGGTVEIIGTGYSGQYAYWDRGHVKYSNFNNSCESYIASVTNTTVNSWVKLTP